MTYRSSPRPTEWVSLLRWLIATSETLSAHRLLPARTILNRAAAEPLLVFSDRRFLPTTVVQEECMSGDALSIQQVEGAGLDRWTLLLYYCTYGLETRIRIGAPSESSGRP